MLKDQPSFHDNLAFIKLTCTCVHVNKRILYTLSGVGLGFRGGVGVVGWLNLIILKTRTVKWYIPTLFEMMFWNCRDKFENKVERALLHYLKRVVTSEKMLKTWSLKHAF